MHENILIDFINIKTLPELIINNLKENGINQISSIRVLYSIILDSISNEIKDSYLNKIQKYLSSSEQSTILIFDDINNGIYDKELKEACHKICQEIKGDSFYKNISNRYA